MFDVPMLTSETYNFRYFLCGYSFFYIYKWLVNHLFHRPMRITRRVVFLRLSPVRNCSESQYLQQVSTIYKLHQHMGLICSIYSVFRARYLGVEWFLDWIQRLEWSVSPDVINGHMTKVSFQVGRHRLWSELEWNKIRLNYLVRCI